MAAASFGSTSPEAIVMLREALAELYGLKGSLWDQYATFWKRIAVADFGPSVSAFPTPVSTLIGRASRGRRPAVHRQRHFLGLLGNVLAARATIAKTACSGGRVIAKGLHPIPTTSILRAAHRLRLPVAVLPLSGGYQ